MKISRFPDRGFLQRKQESRKWLGPMSYSENSLKKRRWGHRRFFEAMRPSLRGEERAYGLTSETLMADVARVLELERNPASRSTLPSTNGSHGSHESVELLDREEKESSMEEGRRESWDCQICLPFLNVLSTLLFFLLFDFGEVERKMEEWLERERKRGEWRLNGREGKN